jgi:hypothetical protein
MSEQHTPGPWNALKKRGRGFVVDVPCGGFEFGYRVAEVHVGEKPDSEIVANAHLIAAAPELLEALKEIAPDYAPHVGCECDQCAPILRAFAALAKAEGR